MKKLSPSVFFGPYFCNTQRDSQTITTIMFATNDSAGLLGTF